ncbi:hypothetical protein HR12_26120 [Microbacterium sp. SUBG005]|nr:hypothetical protein HR12_26120 [Microbacterium sp. SUBG005]
MTRAARAGRPRGTPKTPGGPDHDDLPAEDAEVRTPASPPPSDDGGEPHVDADDPIAAFQPGVGRDSAASSKIAQGLPDPDEA